jgi:hypothetical protein
MRGTQIFLLLCGAGQIFLVYCAIQFWREWRRVHADRFAAHCVRVSAPELHAPRQVIQITERTPRQYRGDTQRIASRAS